MANNQSDSRIMNQDNNLMNKIVSLCKRRGFVYPASEIYGGFANTFDYGPLGAELKRNIKNEWWKKFVLSREDIIGLDSAIIQNPKTWEASGHLSSFSDPLVECKKCHQRFRADQIEETRDLPRRQAGKRQETNKSQNSNEQIQNQSDQNWIPDHVGNDSQRCKAGGEHELTEAKD